MTCSSYYRCLQWGMFLSMFAVGMYGCTSKPMHMPEVAALPGEWTQGAPERAVYLQGMLAPLLEDQRLCALLAAVGQDNFKFATALNRLRRARLETALAENARWPQPASKFEVTRQRPFGGTLAEGARGGTDGSGGAGDTTDKASTSLMLNGSLTYEVDLWNRLGAERDAARWEQSATGEDLRNVRISLLANAVARYYQLAQFNEQVMLTASSLRNSQRTLALVEAQYRVGAAAALELAEARQTVENREATQARLSQQRTEARNAIAELLDGRDVAAFERQTLPAAELQPLPAGLPVALLGQRPDLQAAEFRLRRLDATVTATRASFYPTFTLTATGGGSSAQLKDLLSNPVATLAGAVTLPFLNISKARLATAAARADFDIAAASFQQSLLDAFLEVDNALAAGVNLTREQGHLIRIRNNARVAEHLYEVRYRAGGAPLKEWLDAQDKRLDAQLALNTNRYAQLANRVTALKALGFAVEVPGYPVAGAAATGPVNGH